MNKQDLIAFCSVVAAIIIVIVSFIFMMNNHAMMIDRMYIENGYTQKAIASSYSIRWVKE